MSHACEEFEQVQVCTTCDENEDDCVCDDPMMEDSDIDECENCGLSSEEHE